MTLEQILIELAKKHKKFASGGYSDMLKFNLKTKTIGTSKITIVKDGNIIPQIIRFSDGTSYEINSTMKIFDTALLNSYEELERRFEKYYNSIPDVYEKYRQNQFLCRKFEDFSYSEMYHGVKRQVANTELCLYIMFGELKWENPAHHYWQSKTNKNAIIYKEWIF